MGSRINDIINRISLLEDQLKDELHREEKKAGYRIKNGRVLFDRETRLKHREAVTGLLTYLAQAPLLYVITAPVIYSVIIPALLLDIFVIIYQAVNFRVYKIPVVKRRDYLVFDRQYLGYLNAIEKLNCMYCSYFNGLIAYVAEVAARTELFWCPVKHAKKVAYRHRYYHHFLDYGDQIDYQEMTSRLRENIAGKIENGPEL